MKTNVLPVAALLVASVACRPAERGGAGGSTAVASLSDSVAEDSILAAADVPDSLAPYVTDTIVDLLLSLGKRIDSSLSQVQPVEMRFGRPPSDPPAATVYSDRHGPRRIVQRLCDAAAEDACGMQAFYYARGRVFLAMTWLDRRGPTGEFAPDESTREYYLFVGDKYRAYSSDGMNWSSPGPPLDPPVDDSTEDPGPGDLTTELWYLAQHVRDQGMDLLRRATQR